MPTVRDSWKKAPRVPRVDVSATSDTYIGMRTQAAPTPMPTKNLATMISHNWEVSMMIAQDKRNGADSRRSAFFRPILSAIGPDGMAPKIAPSANNEPIHDPWSSSMTSQESAWYNWGSTGDVQAKAVPVLVAIMQAKKIEAPS